MMRPPGSLGSGVEGLLICPLCALWLSRGEWLARSWRVTALIAWRSQLRFLSAEEKGNNHLFIYDNFAYSVS